MLRWRKFECLIRGAAAFLCVISVEIAGKPAYQNWFAFWTAAVAVVGMCVLGENDGQAMLYGIRLRFVLAVDSLTSLWQLVKRDSSLLCRANTIFLLWTVPSEKSCRSRHV